ncbi:hypothetical protein ACIRRA_43810 [Nocardia sp. NPDC101769]|uniref:hypothetical protein n=1 Tax=Nocardia sp. NPDC101769 TaxID=3364333 RepID=UPI00381B6F31
MDTVCRALAEYEGVSAEHHEHYIEPAWRERADLGDDGPHLGRLRRRRPHGPVHDFLAEHVAPGEDSPRWTDLQRLRRILGVLIADSPGPNYTITRLRGAQAAFWLHGWYLELRNLPCAVGPGLTTIPFTAELAARIRAGLASSVRAAALAVTVFTGALPGELTALRGDHMAADGSWIASGPQGHRVFVVPTLARPLLLAARTYLQLTDPQTKGLLIDSTGAYGRTVRASSADACRILLPARHSYNLTWLANASAFRHWPRLRPDDADLRYALALEAHPSTVPRDTGRPSATDQEVPILRRPGRTRTTRALGPVSGRVSGAILHHPVTGTTDDKEHRCHRESSSGSPRIPINWQIFSNRSVGAPSYTQVGPHQQAQGRRPTPKGGSPGKKLGTATTVFAMPSELHPRASPCGDSFSCDPNTRDVIASARRTQPLVSK